MHPAQFEIESARALKYCRFQLDLRPGERKTGKLNVFPRRGRDGRMLGYDVFLVDTTRGARDQKIGTPQRLNDTPIPTMEDAHEYGMAKITGRNWFYWRGARAHSIGEGPAPRAVVAIKDAPPPWLKGRANAR